MKWFNDVTTIEELHKRYKQLLKQYHPDNNGGDDEITKEINAEYDRLFADLSHDNNSDEETYTQEENEQFKAILNEIIGYNITIEVIGSWVWCFDCFAYKDRLKALGFRYAPKKKAWTWHYGEYKRYHKSEISLDDIRMKYGSQKVSNYHKQYAIS